MLKPLEDRVIILQEKEEEKKSDSGLILTAMETTANNIGRIVAVGQGRVLPNGERAEMDVKVGDLVAFNPYATQKIEEGGNEYDVVFTKDLIAIIEE
jgi:chaperonin GroES